MYIISVHTYLDFSQIQSRLSNTVLCFHCLHIQLQQILARFNNTRQQKHLTNLGTHLTTTSCRSTVINAHK